MLDVDKRNDWPAKPKRHVAIGTEERGDFIRGSANFDRSRSARESWHNDSRDHSQDRQCEDKLVKRETAIASTIVIC